LHACLKNSEVVFQQTDGGSVAALAGCEIAENAGSKNARQTFFGPEVIFFSKRILNFENCVVWV